jgi:hypothetical protein
MSDGSNPWSIDQGGDDDLFDAALNAPETGFEDDNGGSAPPAPAAAAPAPTEPPGAVSPPAEVPAAPAPAAPAAEPAAPVKEPVRVPVSELQAERRRRQELEARLRELEGSKEPAKPAPQIWDDPDNFVDRRVEEKVTPVLDRVSQVVHTYSERDAVREFGRETVDAALTTLDERCAAGDQAAIAFAKASMGSADPYGDLVRWNKEHEVRTTVGTDLAGYQSKLLEDPDFLAKAVAAAHARAAGNTVIQGAPAAANQNAAPATAIPSLNKGGQSAPVENIAEREAKFSDDDWYDLATRPRDERGRFMAA